MLAKKTSFLLLFQLLISSSLFAQIILPSSDSLNFGSVDVGEVDSLQLTLQNTSFQPLQINNVKFYTIYNDFPFSASSSSFSIPANGSISIWIYFEPRHNILHNSEMVIFHNAKSGMESIDLRGQGVFPNPYYNVTQNLEEEPLKVALRNRIGQGYTQLSYNAARDAMFMTIDNKAQNGQGAPTNSLECVYTGYVKNGYTSRSDAQNTNPQFNTEHTFPQGLFNQVLPQRSDIHHLFPTTNNSNSQRGSKPFGVVTNGTPVTLGGGSFYNSTTFEPRNAQKGRTARAMMYFVIRYQDYSGHFAVQENILRSWHDTYPPDSIDRRRNDDIFAVQNNRNPFIDYPQLEERITNFVSNSTKPVLNGLDITQSSIDFGTVVQNSADTFDYVLVNRGNQTIDFSNIQLLDTSIFSFTAGFNPNQSIAAGDALIVPIVIEPVSIGFIQDILSLETSIPGGLSSLNIPILANSEVGLYEYQLLNHLKVFPNPFEDVLFVENELGRSLELRLFDARGRELKRLKSNQSQIEIATDKLSKGVYFLELSNEDEKRVLKIIK
jgi:hypothetical protein